MRIKLDENLGNRLTQVFREAGHGVQTVRDEQLQGRPDEAIYEVCRLESRCLVTLDLDFSNVLRFPPAPTAGIVVLRVDHGIGFGVLVRLAGQLIRALHDRPIEGEVWIVEPGRIRIHQTE